MLGHPENDAAQSSLINIRIVDCVNSDIKSGYVPNILAMLYF